MAIPYIFSTAEEGKVVNGDYTRVASGGTAMDGSSAVLEIAYDDTAFTDADGKERLIQALEEVILLLESPNTIWPLTA